MTDTEKFYLIFNQVEGFVWITIAILLPVCVPAKNRRQKLSVFGASAGFILFALTDFAEATSFGNVSYWLWTGKITSASFLLSCRFHYIGWKNFRFTDRYFVFAIFCLIATLCIMASAR